MESGTLGEILRRDVGGDCCSELCAARCEVVAQFRAAAGPNPCEGLARIPSDRRMLRLGGMRPKPMATRSSTGVGDANDEEVKR